MLKQLTVPLLGVAVLAATAVPAAADKGNAYFVKPHRAYVYDSEPGKRTVTTSKPQYKRKFDPKLDVETEAVWRNLRPSWFD